MRRTFECFAGYEEKNATDKIVFFPGIAEQTGGDCEAHYEFTS